jgi:hypothetical protein
MKEGELSQRSSPSVTEGISSPSLPQPSSLEHGQPNLSHDDLQQTQLHRKDSSSEKQKVRSATWSDHVSTREGDIVYQTFGERDESTQEDDSNLKTPRTPVLDRHIRSLSGHFQDATKLSPDNSITYSPEPDDPPYFTQQQQEQQQEQEISYPLQEQVGPYDFETAPTLGKHRRGPSSGNTNPVMAHRRMDSGGHAAFVQREGGYSQPSVPLDPYQHHQYPGVPSPTAQHSSIPVHSSPPQSSWVQTYPVVKSSPNHYPRDIHGHPQQHWSKRSTPPRSSSPYYYYPPQPPMTRGHYRDPSPPLSSHRPLRDSSPHHRDVSPSYNGAQLTHYTDSAQPLPQGQYREPTPPTSRGHYRGPSPPSSGGYYRQPSPTNGYLHHPPNVPSPQIYAAPQYEPFTYSPDPYHPQHSPREGYSNYDGSAYSAPYGRPSTAERKFPSYPPPHPLSDHKSQSHPTEYRRQASYSSIGSHESKLEIEEHLNLSNKDFPPLQVASLIRSNSHTRISPQMFMSTLNDPAAVRGSPPEKIPLQHSMDSAERHRKQSSLTNAQIKKFIHDVGISNRSDRADSAGSFIQKHGRAYSGETFTIGNDLFGEDLLEAPSTPHSLGSISHSSHKLSHLQGAPQSHEANRMYDMSNVDVYYADLGSAPAYYQPPPSMVHAVASNEAPVMNRGHNSSVSLYSHVSSTSDANSDAISNSKKNGSKRTRRKCVMEGCTNRVVQGGRCITHGAQRKKCGHPGCNKNVKKAGMCSTHGPPRKLCDSEGCQKVAVQGGKCISHGAKKKYCNVENCKKQAILNGMCKKHHDLFESGICLPVQSKDELGAQNSSMEAPQGGHTRGLSAFGDISTVNSIIEGGLGYTQVNDGSNLGVWKS